MQRKRMRWTIRLGAALALLWVAYAISPYVAAYRLAAAVQARDVEAVKTRVNFRAVRLSLAKQILAIYLTTTGEGGTSEVTAHQLASAAVEIAEPLMAQLLSPEMLLDLLDDGWPQSIVAEKPADAPVPGHAGAPQPVQPARIGLGSPRLTWRDLLVMVDTRGFRKFYLTLPGALGPESRVRLYFRFGPWFWRLYGVELPTTLARRLADELRKRIGRRH